MVNSIRLSAHSKNLSLSTYDLIISRTSLNIIKVPKYCCNSVSLHKTYEQVIARISKISTLEMAANLKFWKNVHKYFELFFNIFWGLGFAID